MPNIVQRPNDPYIYLYVMGEWYCYNPREPLIGSGAMGDVYRGYRCKTSSVVAIKRVKDSYANNKQIRDRARQEASLAFRHPNLVEMVGCCEYEPGRGPMFLISNFVNGEDVDQYVAKMGDTPGRVEKICHIISMVLDALDYVHSKGIVHRDVKPSNIMVEQGQNVRLMDLGIARMNGGNSFSAFGFIGTPEYAAPEQILREQDGKNVNINAATDIYALGITFYELLTGTNPMNSDKDVEVLDRQMHKPLPPDKSIPPRLMKVILKATEKDPLRRYQTANEMKLAIKQALEPEPTPGQRFKQWMADNVVVVSAILACLVVIALLITIILI